MALTAGTRLGPYEVTALIGAGGMGEVYRATDTRLDRTVAIKVLPEHLADDPQRRERFEREAKAVSSLNHPHICTLHDVGEQDGIHYLVMEYVEGETLQQRLEKGRLPLDQALEYAIQIADALDKAHRQGVVHRDLKPGNIMITKSGTKLLDFGLAKLKARSAPLDQWSTIEDQEPLTAEGEILGTLQYMAPEQLEGNEADARTDIFAFGTTVYEMVTGKRAFQGKSQASLIAAILRAEPPPISSVQPVSPPALDRLVRKALVKDPEDRWQDARDVTGELQWIADAGSGDGTAASTLTAERPAVWWRLMPLTSALLVGGLVAGLTVWSLTRPDPRMATRLTVPIPTNPAPRGVALSPDGRTLVYASRGEDDVTRLYRRELDQLEATLIPGTENATFPFFSPTGEWVGFFAYGAFGAHGTLKTTALAGGTPVTLWEGALISGASWGPDDTIVLGGQGPHGDERSGLWQISASGGDPIPMTTLNLDEGEGAHFLPQFLPGGQAVLFMVEFGEGSADREKTQIAVLSLDTGERRLLMQGTDFRHAPGGHIVFVRGGSLWRVPFDAGRLEVTGQPVPIPEPVAVRGGSATFAFGGNGTLAYVPSYAVVERSSTLVWVDREGNEAPLAAEPRNYRNPDVSPDGESLALVVGREERDLWIYDLARNTPTRLTFESAIMNMPRWSPDGRRVAFALSPDGLFPNLFWRAADGTGEVERLTSSPNEQFPTGWSPDGQRLLFYEFGPDRQADLWVLSLEGDEPAPGPLLQAEFNQRYATLSPDSRWVAYTSDESGEPEIFVRPFPNVDNGKWQVSTNGGRMAEWGPDGRELIYEGQTALIAVAVETEPTFAPGTPEMLFDLTGYRRNNQRSCVGPRP